MSYELDPFESVKRFQQKLHSEIRSDKLMGIAFLLVAAIIVTLSVFGLMPLDFGIFVAVPIALCGLYWVSTTVEDYDN